MRSALCASLSVAGLALKCALFGVLLQGSPLFADIHYVDLASPDPAPPYTNWANAATTIQEAVDAAADGDTVLVADGIYDTGGVTNYPEGSLLLNRVAIYKPITVRSVNGPTNTLIQGYQDPVWTNGDDAVRCVFMTNGTALSASP
jgi:hypothetical protein